ncbi:MAG: phosphoethanolamine transferase [Roseateles sp.]|uniref:phosphoethanolamine transferase n=1 Tax=Roseateles sp. TaxID=1971397 RepID=UPI0040370008
MQTLLPAVVRRPLLLRPRLSTDGLLALLCLYWAMAANRPFLAAADHAWTGQPGGLALLVLLVALLHFVLLAPLVHRRWAKPALLLLSVIAAVGGHFTQAYGTAFDPAMLRNAMRTDWPEARELLSGGLLLHVLVILVPAWWFILQTELAPVVGRRRASLLAVGRWLLAVVAAAALLVYAYQPLSGLMRERRELRYQLLPAAPIWSLPRSLVAARTPPGKREPIGVDAKPGASWSATAKPRLLVLVVGETVRAANWGRRDMEGGGVRDTTPLLRQQSGLLSWARVSTCGSDTETSLPCMFAPVGRRDYDESRIRRQESLLQVLARAGVQVQWLDNQSGCKGVCDAATEQALACEGGRCLDGALFDRVQAVLREARPGTTRLLVLHMLGNHGPAYHRRVPPQFGPYGPACSEEGLGGCERAAIVNAYDNALRYTDELLATLWQRLQAAQGQVDTALIFLPDHGESLGERGLYLHGLPYAIAPKEQIEVPMLMGIAPSWAATRGWGPGCLARLPEQPASHEHLFHTVLDLLDVRTGLMDARWDLLAACRA